mmetsp:Transcript_71435/g.149149  ORF Transcript_71435/g.149149 Transcript_71435/m.149149 type:complete len:98 (-) Transcript_71435:122-415(-)
MSAGGFSANKDATAEEQSILDSVKGEVETQLSKTFTVFQLMHFQTQVVAGVNYMFKVRCDDEYVHVKVCKPLPHTGKPPFVMVAVGGHSEDSELVPL